MLMGKMGWSCLYSSQDGDKQFCHLRLARKFIHLDNKNLLILIFLLKETLKSPEEKWVNLLWLRTCFQFVPNR